MKTRYIIPGRTIVDMRFVHSTFQQLDHPAITKRTCIFDDEDVIEGPSQAKPFRFRVSPDCKHKIYGKTYTVESITVTLDRIKIVNI